MLCGWEQFIFSHAPKSPSIDSAERLPPTLNFNHQTVNNLIRVCIRLLKCIYT